MEVNDKEDHHSPCILQSFISVLIGVFPEKIPLESQLSDVLQRDGGAGYHDQEESARGPGHAGHRLQLPGPSVCEDRETSVNVCILNDNDSLLTFLH